jgi:hypothetical protein
LRPDESCLSGAPRPPAKGTAYDTDNCTWLNIQYTRKDQAKRLGAKWDTLTKRWYVPHYVSLAPFFEAKLIKAGSDQPQPSKGRATGT